MMVIKFRRKIMSEMMTTYLPSMLLMMITYATTFFKPHLIEAALSVNLTTMLVMTTIFISKMEGLPPTSDTKMIDVWLIICQLVPFAEVVLLTAMEYYRKDQDEEITDEVIPKVTASTQTRLSIRSITHGAINSTFETRNTNVKHHTSNTQTNDKEEMSIQIESQWSKICQKSWFPSLKSIGLFVFIQGSACLHIHKWTEGLEYT